MGRGARALSVVLAAGVLAACDATLMETRRRERGPVAEVGLIDAGAGQARYPVKGPGWLVAARRAKAMRLIEKYCQGASLFKVTAERDQELTETRYNEDDLEPEEFMLHGHYKVDTYRVVDFECVKP